MHLKGVDIKEEFPSFSFETSIIKLLAEGLEYNGNKVAQIEDGSGKSYTFRDILQQSKSIAAGLSRAGIAPGDFVVICCSKSSLAYSALLGVMFTGAIPVLIGVNYAKEIHKYTKGKVVKAVFCDKIDLHSVNESLCQMNPEPTLIATTDLEDTTMKLLLLPSSEFSVFEVKDNKKNVVLVLFTSGSTSDPKGVQVSDLGLQRLGYSFVDESIDCYLLTSSFSWISSTISLVSSILKGYSLILSESKDPAFHLKLIEKYKVNGWTMFGPNMNRYINKPSVDLSSLTVINVGAAVVTRTMTETFVTEVLKGRTGIQVIYGTTEIGLITTWRNKDLLELSKADSSGYLAPGVEVKVTDEQERLVEPGRIGEIRVQSMSMMSGYWGSAETDLQPFDNDGFFRTGDAGYFDNDGFLYIVGRMGDLVTHGGSKVSVPAVEEILKSHSGVMDAAVVTKRHQYEDFHLFAFIVVKPGSHIREEDISVFVAEKVGGTEILKGVHVVEAIPQTHSGKVHRGMLHSMMHKLHKII